MPNNLIRLSDTRWKYGKHYIKMTRQREENPQPPFEVIEPAHFVIDDEEKVTALDVDAVCRMLDGGVRVNTVYQGSPISPGTVITCQQCGATSGQYHARTCMVAGKVP